MPKFRHPQLKRTLAQALLGMDKAMIRLLELEKIFRPHHPEMAEFLELMARNIQMSHKWALDFWEQAWGKRPEDYNSYR